MDLEKIKDVKRLKDQCKRYGVHYTDIARECGFNIPSFLAAMQNGSMSRERLNKAYAALKRLVARKNIEYNEP